MSLGWRSTSVSLAARCCARVLDHLERGDPYPRDVFGQGKAAHECLEALGKASSAGGLNFWAGAGAEEKVLRETCERLIRDGSNFEGELEPPLPADVVWAGRDLALRYVRTTMGALGPGEYELGLAVNRHWQLCPYGKDAYYRARVDRWHIEAPSLMDDFDAGTVGVCTDYKSAWNVDGGPIGLQQKGQAVLCWKAWGSKCDSLRIDVVNIRNGQTYSYPIFPKEEDGAALLARWQADIDSSIAAFPPKGPDGWRPASPGARCFGCPYLHRCPPGRDAATEVYGTDDPEALARSYAAYEAFLASFKPLLQLATAEEPIKVDGAVVGTVAKTQKIASKDGPAVVAAAWNRKTHPETVEAARALFEGFILRSGMTLANMKKLLAHLYSGDDQERAKRDKLVRSITTTKTVRSFGVHRESGELEDVEE